MLSSATPERTLLQRYRRALLRHAPPTHARMTPADYTAKYLRADPLSGAPYEAITDSDLAAHLAGEITLAAQLQHGGQSHLAACDLDAGGEAALRRVQQAAERRGCHAVAIALDAGPHDGGHVWIVFRDAHPAEDLRALMCDILVDAGIAGAEVYPSAADLRLPLGLHRRAGRRGRLIAHSDAAARDIDADPRAALAAFLDACAETDAAPVLQARADQEARAHAAAAQAAARAAHAPPPAWDGDGRALIQAFNAATDLVTLLEAYGARVAHRYANGRVVLHCAAPQDHRHGDAHPSLLVQPGTGGQTGKLICGCFTPGCRLHNAPGQVKDAFEVYCILEGISHREGMRRQRQRLGSAARPARPAPGMRPAPPPRQLPPPAAPAQQTLALAPQDVVRSPAANDWRTQVQQRLAALQRDLRARPMDRRLYAYLAARCTTGPSCRPSNARCAEALEVSIDTIKFTKRRLRTLGYITVEISTDGRNTSVVDLLPGAGAITRGVIVRSPDKLRIGFTKKGGGDHPPAPVENPDLPHQDAQKRTSAMPVVPATAHAPAPQQRARPTASPAPSAPRVAASAPADTPADQRAGLSALSHAELERKRYRLIGAAAKAVNERQRFVLLRLVAEIDDEVARRRLEALLAHDPADDPPAAEASYHGPAAEPDDASDRQHAPPGAPPVCEEPAAARRSMPADAAVGVPNQAAPHEEPAGCQHVLEESRAEPPAAAGPQEADDVPYDGPPFTLASPGAPHPPLGDAQLTELVRRGLRTRVRGRHYMLIQQVAAQQAGGGLTLVCAPHHLALVEREVAPYVARILTEAGLDGVFAAVRVRPGEVSVALTTCPAWLTPMQWAALPVAVQAMLAGASIVGTTLYGATPKRTAQLADDSSGAVAYLLHLLSLEGITAPSAASTLGIKRDTAGDAGACYNNLDGVPEVMQGCNHATPANLASGCAKPSQSSDGISQPPI